MKTKTFAIGTKGFVLGLCAISALGFFALPTRADDAVIQDSTQETINTGEGNASIQNSNQESQINRSSRDEYGNYDRSDSGIVQTNDQYCDQLGEDNLCVQNTDQRSEVRERRSR